MRSNHNENLPYRLLAEMRMGAHNKSAELIEQFEGALAILEDAEKRPAGIEFLKILFHDLRRAYVTISEERYTAKIETIACKSLLNLHRVSQDSIEAEAAEIDSKVIETLIT